MGFDAYRKWLGISSKRRPPTYYDLLGIEPGENDREVIVSALQQRRAFIRSKKGEGYDGQVRNILGQFDEAASTLLVPEFKNAYDRQLGLHLKRKRRGFRAYIVPTWMESRIVRIYGEGSGIILDTLGIVSVIAAAIGIMVLSGLWLKSQTSASESSSVLTLLERFTKPTVAKAEPETRDDGLGSRVTLAPPDRLREVAVASKSRSDEAHENTSAAEKKRSPPSKPLPKSFRSPSTHMELALIPAGTFTMGSGKMEPDRNDNETPHQVTISSEFYLGKYEVTQAEFQQVMGFNPSKFTGSKRLPVENVTWFDAVWMCNKLSEHDGYQACYQITEVEKDGDNIKSANVVLDPAATGYRLPTEAEWEYACRAGSTTPFSFGDNVKTYEVNYDGRRPYNGAAVGTVRGKTIEVDMMRPNAWGLSQMHGNVWEWCHDWKGDYGTASVSDPMGPATGSVRVGRGGTWDFPAAECRSAQRLHSYPSGHDRNLGFRIALVPPPQVASAKDSESVRHAPTSMVPVSSIVEARSIEDDQWYRAQILEHWESLHLCRYAGYSGDFDEWLKPNRIRPALAGEWSGSWQNDGNESGPDTLQVAQDERDFITGVWSGNVPFRGERIGPNTIYFEGMTKQRQYQCIGVLEGNRLRLEYRALRVPQGGRYFGWCNFSLNGSSQPKPRATPPSERHSFAGSWVGTFDNSKSETVEQTLKLMENDDILIGELAGVRLGGVRISSSSFRLAGTNGAVLFHVVGRMEKDRLKLHFTATSNQERYFGQGTLMTK